MSVRKKNKILILLFEVVESDTMLSRQVLSLCGKLNHYSALFLDGKFERNFLLELVDNTNLKARVVVSKLAKSQAAWWIRALGPAVEPAPIPLPGVFAPAWALEVFPDAAGGSLKERFSGFGAVAWNLPARRFVVFPWSWLINSGELSSLGVKFNHKLSMLEGVAALSGLIMVKDLAVGRAVRIWTDNAGLVHAYNKAHSKCPYVHSVVKAINTVARALDCRVMVEKVPRCSSDATTAADALSKGDVTLAKGLMGHYEIELGYISRTLLAWLEDPVPTRVLGVAIVKELAKTGPVLDLEVEWSEEVVPMVRYPRLEPYPWREVPARS